MLVKIIFAVAAIRCVICIRGEHKVHNIILNPEKYSRCQTTRIQQVVASPGYEPVTIDNNVCVGWCYSYSIPSTQPAEPGELIGPYCDSCQPVETKCYHVTLRSDGKNSESPKFFQKRVQIIKKCSCMSCEKAPREDCDLSSQTTLELPQDLFFNKSEDVKDEVPELLNFPNNKNRPQILNLDLSNATNFDVNMKLINLLKSIQNEGEDSNLSYDKNQLEELLKIIEDSKSQLSDKNLMELINFVNVNNSENFELDLSRLKEVLSAFQKHKELMEESQLRHRLGDEVHAGLDLGHLIAGPHHSLIMAPNLKVEEKLNIDSDVLKPNHDGVVIDYENHRKNDVLTN